MVGYIRLVASDLSERACGVLFRNGRSVEPASTYDQERLTAAGVLFDVEPVVQDEKTIQDLQETVKQLKEQLAKKTRA